MISIIGTVLFLVFLEGMLSFDNALVLAALASRLPPNQQKKALTWGMWGAMGFRFLALTVLTYLLKSVWIKFVGAGYLLYLAGSHFIGLDEEDEETKAGSANFWKTILMVELTDIAFSSDSILASVGVSDKFWIIFTGGVLGIIMMRFAAVLFIRLIQKFPRFETVAYVLIAEIGVKLLTEGLGLAVDPIYFWSVMGLAVLSGFTS